VVVSDALDMAGASSSLGMAGAAVAALQAGCDLLCPEPNTDGQLTDIERAVKGAVAEGHPFSKGLGSRGSVRGLAEDLIAAQRTAGPPPRSAPSWPGDAAALIHASMYNLERRTGARGLRGDTPWCALRRIPISPLE
jgi:beta-N-acetylhexosaminidase